MADTNQNIPGTIPNEPPPPPPESQAGTFVIPDIEPYTSIPGQAPSSVVSPSVPNQAPEPETSIHASAPQTNPLPAGVGSNPFQTVIIDEQPPQAGSAVQPGQNVSSSQQQGSSGGSFVTNYSAEQSALPPFNNDTLPQAFIPQGLMPEPSVAAGGASSPNTPPPIPKKTSGIGKKILFILLFLLLLGGVAIGIRFGVQLFNDNQQVTLEYWGLWEQQSLVAPVIADFQAKNPKITINYIQQNHRQYRERLQAAINRGEGPDVFRFHATWVPMLQNEIQPVPADIMSPSQFTSQFYKVASQDLLSGSTLWGIPIEIDGLGLYINEELFTAAGVSPPQTYEDLLSIVPMLTVKDGDAIITSAIALGTTNNIEHFSDILALMILQNGAKLSNPTGREAEEALIFYKKFSTPSDPLYTWNSLLDNSVSSFANGRVAMIFAPSWRVFDIKAINPALRFRIEPVPQLPGNTLTWASYWVEGVSAKSKHKKQAMAFLQYLTSKDAVIKLYTEASKQRLFGEPYALIELGSSVASDPFVGAYIKQAPHARSFPLASLTHDNGINDRMIQYMKDAINSVDKNVAPSQALNTMAKGFQQVLSSYGLGVSGTTQQ
jgi:multiple sugar transport system substrate-binding protein